MDFKCLIDRITPEIYENLKQAVELGKWPNGEPLSKEQRESCLQAVIAWDIKHKPEEQRVGYVNTTPHPHCGKGGEVAMADETPLSWKH